MRTSTLNGMLASLATNYNRRNKDVRLYELGNIYLPKSLPVTELPDERTHVYTWNVWRRRFLRYEGCHARSSSRRSE